MVATLITNSVVCLEEPEIHLHPLFQRKLVRYLSTTTNQYFIATHSAQLLDFEKASIYHLQYIDGASTVNRTPDPGSLSSLCFDLGYRPSDLLQANCIIWVEGPSDRLYLRHWISLVNDKLVEGIHFSIMFYGGRLLSHLTPDEVDLKEVDDFISLRRINRQMLIMIDSDKTSADDNLNATKRRVIKAFDDVPVINGFAWETAGRTVENYVPPELLKTAIETAYPKMPVSIAEGPWVDRLAPSSFGGRHLDKVRIAREACSQFDATHLNNVDELASRIQDTVQFIKFSNSDLNME
jgi:AAA domain, putative AbiEii toxin, Type IV TA system